MQLKFNVKFYRGTKLVATVEGVEMSEERAGKMTIGELTEQVQQTEAFVERLTGLRCHIEQVE